MRAISVVIPTYNRPEQLSGVLDHLLASDAEGLSDVEVIVVDDGSAIPVRNAVESIGAVHPFRLKYIYQKNAGPAEARNNGFRLASNQIVLFIDDDILVFPDLLRRHVEAHEKFPGSVIFGQSPYAVPETLTPSYEYLEGLNEQGIAGLGPRDDSGFVRLETIASGNISFEKSMFVDSGAIYGTDLSIPVGEEFELALRLREKNIPIYMCPEIKGWHLQPATISDSANQNYKYGLGIAEVVEKKPEVLKFEPVRNVFEHNRPIQPADPLKIKLKKSVRRFLAQKSVRRFTLRSIVTIESVLPAPSLLHPLYRLIVGTYFYAGLRDGLRSFKKV